MPKDPEPFYFQFCPPGVNLKNSNWTIKEKKEFLEMLMLRPPDEKWGLFSMNFPGRTGAQCKQFYESLEKSGELLGLIPEISFEVKIPKKRGRKKKTKVEESPGSETVSEDDELKKEKPSLKTQRVSISAGDSSLPKEILQKPNKLRKLSELADISHKAPLSIEIKDAAVEVVAPKHVEFDSAEQKRPEESSNPQPRKRGRPRKIRVENVPADKLAEANVTANSLKTVAPKVKEDIETEFVCKIDVEKLNQYRYPRIDILSPSALKKKSLRTPPRRKLSNLELIGISLPGAKDFEKVPSQSLSMESERFQLQATFYLELKRLAQRYALELNQLQTKIHNGGATRFQNVMGALLNRYHNSTVPFRPPQTIFANEKIKSMMHHILADFEQSKV